MGIILEKGRKQSYQDFLFAIIIIFNLLSNNKILDWSKLKALADDKINVTKKLTIATGRVEDIVGKGVNADYHHFFLFPLCFEKVLINPFPHNDTFCRPWETSLLKTLWEKEKFLVTSNFSFSHSVFYPFG